MNNSIESASTWSDVEESSTAVEKLRSLCNSNKELKRQGYITAPLSEEAILNKLRCKNCGARMRSPQGSFIVGGGCVFHPGRVLDLHFTCCQAHVSKQAGCHVNIGHVAPDNYVRILGLSWTYYPTQTERPRLSSRTNSKKPAAISTRSAIALDCEFGVSVINEQELLRITAVDFFSKEVLLDSLVKPAVRIKNYNTRYSGVSSRDVRNAVRDKKCIFGRDAARRELMKYVGQDTIVIMHGGSSDMTSLRWIHPNILDTCILASKCCRPAGGGTNLKNMCEQKLGIKIQRGKKGHDSREDALACRELAIWMMKNDVVNEPEEEYYIPIEQGWVFPDSSTDAS